MNLKDFNINEKALGKLCSITNGSTKFQSKEKTNFPITRIETISNGFVNKSKVNYVEFTQDERTTFCLHSGDILFSHINSFERIGHCALVLDKDLPIYHGMNLLRLQPFKNEILPEYLFIYLKTSNAKKFYEEFAQRAINQASINQNTLKELKIIYPSELSDQHKIASEIKKKLQSIDQMRQAALKQKEAVEAMQGALLREIFPYKVGDKLPEGWKWKKIGNIINKEIKTFSKEKFKEFIYVDISAIDNFQKKILFPKKVLVKDSPSRAKFILNEGDILISNVRPNLNAVAVVAKDYSNSIGSSGFTVIRPSDLYHTGFLFLFFTSPYFINYVTELVQGAMYPAISEKDVYKCSIPIPELSKQIEIYNNVNNQLNKFFEINKQSDTQLEAIEALPASILREVFEFKS